MIIIPYAQRRSAVQRPLQLSGARRRESPCKRPPGAGWQARRGSPNICTCDCRGRGATPEHLGSPSLRASQDVLGARDDASWRWISYPTASMIRRGRCVRREYSACLPDDANSVEYSLVC